MSRLHSVSRLVLLVAVLLISTTIGSEAIRLRGDTTHDSQLQQETPHLTNLPGIDPQVLASADQEIAAQLALERDLNQRATVQPLVAGTIPDSAKDTTFAFLAQLEATPVHKNTVDVESHLDTIATELSTLFKTDAEMKAEADAKAAAEALSHTRAGRLAAKKKHQAEVHAARVAALKEARLRAKEERLARLAAKHEADLEKQAAKASKRQQRLITRVDGYRQQRGHDDVSTLESQAEMTSTTETEASQQQQAQGYSLPSAYAPGQISPAQAAAAAAYPGQVTINPFIAAQLGFAPPAPVAPVVQAAAPQANNIGLLLRALEKVQEEQETNKLVNSLSALLSAATPKQPQVIPSPFNYGQQLLATPQGYVNPNLLPQTFGPRLLPGGIPGQSPAYPSFIPADNARVGVADEQPNPFEAHQP